MEEIPTEIHGCWIVVKLVLQSFKIFLKLSFPTINVYVLDPHYNELQYFVLSFPVF